MDNYIRRAFIVETVQYGDMEKMGEGELLYPRRNFQDRSNFVVINPDSGNIVLKVIQARVPQWNHRFIALHIRHSDIDLFDVIKRHMRCIEIEGDLNLYKLQFTFLDYKLNGGELLSFEPGYYGV